MSNILEPTPDGRLLRNERSRQAITDAMPDLIGEGVVLTPRKR